jgi:mono/diheme cytochrome c family protein
MRRALAFLCLLFAAPAFAAPDGAKLYRDQCARCHGDAGQGVKKKYDKPLAGDLAVPQLADLVQKTMPEDNPESLSEADAAAIAGYMHEKFYSAIARERTRPARVELSRLTVSQYRHAVADLIGGFRGTAYKWADGGKGLKGEYFGDRAYRTKMLDRLDAAVAFDFGTELPFTRPETKEPANPGRRGGGDVKKADDPAKKDDGKPVDEKKAKEEAAKKAKEEAERKAREEAQKHEYSIRWSGSLLAPDTGEYTFVVKSDQAVKLWVNGGQPIVNALVKSGNQTEYTAAVPLTGGRVYDLRLEFSKALQGVKDKKPKPTPAFVRLEWKPPHGAQEPIPARVLSPHPAPEQHVVAVSFPPDDKSMGWERGTAVSKEWDAATTEAALQASAYVVANADTFLGAAPPPRNLEAESGNPASVNLDKKAGRGPVTDREKKMRAFAAEFVQRAFRRPLTPEQKELYVDRQFAVAGSDLDAALRRVVLLALKSPRFLYREVNGAADDFDTAARLSFALWDSAPDEALRTAAAKGELKTPEQIRKHAERMLADPRAEAKLRGFLLHWLRLDQDRDLGKNEKLYPGFDAAAVADLRVSLELFLTDVLADPKADFRRLLTADEVYLNGRLAKWYGADLPADAPFQKVKLDPGKRAGVLTHPYLLSAFAYADHSSPIHRGVFLAKGVLGVALQPPQEAFSPLAPSLHPTLTTRERVALQTKGANCQTCHAVINPLGFSLEGFDAIGKLRSTDNNKPVDTKGEYLTRSGERKAFDGAAELSKFLAASPEAHEAFAEQMFHHLIQQPVRAYGSKRDEELRDSFVKSGYNIRTLAADIATTAALSGRK